MVSEERGRTPLIVRVAGLPAELMDEFSSPALLDRIAQREELSRRIEDMRSALVGCLHGAVGSTPKEKRGFLLAAKRDCFNARSLRAYREQPEWALLAEIAGTLADGVVELEREIEAAEAGFEELHHRELHREWSTLVRLLGHRKLVRGLTLASPELARNLGRLDGKAPDAFGRRERRLMPTLLRYASRAAVKLSPFSTLTRTGLGMVGAGEGGQGFTFPQAGRWRERSVPSLRRELLTQGSFLLLRSRRFSETLEICLNDTLEDLGEGRYFFFRPDHWEFDGERQVFKYCEETFVRVRLEGPLAPWLHAGLGDGPMVFSQLRERLRNAFPDEGPDFLDEGLEALLGIGFLFLVPAWGLNEPDLERQMLRHLAPGARTESSAPSSTG